MLFFLLGCAPTTILGPIDDAPADTAPLVTDTTGDLGSGFEAVEDDDPIDTIDGGWSEDWIFDPDMLHTLDIVISEENITKLNDETTAYSTGDPVYVPADIWYDGELVEQVGVRIKGRWGSWRSLSQKSSFKIDFNRYVDGQTFYGLKGLTMNNMVIDCSYMREHIAYQVYRAGGSPAPRTAYTRVSLNGDDFGLYLNVEIVDDVFLRKNFDDARGKLYDADYKLWDDGSYTVLDFETELVEYYDQEEGDEGDRSELYALAALLDESEWRSDSYERTAELVDWPSHLRLMANEMWTGQIDGYSLNRNNYFAYFSGGKMQILPWDHDYAFLDESSWNFSWRWPQGRLSSLCVNSAACVADLKPHIEAVIDTASGLDIRDRVDDTADWLAPEIATDPRRECSASYIAYYQDALRDWSWRRSSDLRRDWDL